MDNILNIVNEYSIFIVLGLAVITILLFLITIILMISVSKVNKRYKKMMVIKHDQIDLQNEFYIYAKKIYTIEISVIIAVYIISKVF